MNIIEAIKSDKNFRRPGLEWLYIEGFIVLQSSNHRPFTFLSDDLTADDWEVKED